MWGRFLCIKNCKQLVKRNKKQTIKSSYVVSLCQRSSFYRHYFSFFAQIPDRYAFQSPNTLYNWSPGLFKAMTVCLINESWKPGDVLIFVEYALQACLLHTNHCRPFFDSNYSDETACLEETRQKEIESRKSLFSPS